jgi:hypothetical protein
MYKSPRRLSKHRKRLWLDLRLCTRQRNVGRQGVAIEVHHRFRIRARKHAGRCLFAQRVLGCAKIVVIDIRGWRGLDAAMPAVSHVAPGTARE